MQRRGLVLELVDFESHMRGVDLVITGEGCLDEQSLHGKAPVGVATVARRNGSAPKSRSDRNGSPANFTVSSNSRRSADSARRRYEETSLAIAVSVEIAPLVSLGATRLFPCTPEPVSRAPSPPSIQPPDAWRSRAARWCW